MAREHTHRKIPYAPKQTRTGSATIMQLYYLSNSIALSANEDIFLSAPSGFASVATRRYSRPVGAATTTAQRWPDHMQSCHCGYLQARSGSRCAFATC